MSKASSVAYTELKRCEGQETEATICWRTMGPSGDEPQVEAIAQKDSKTLGRLPLELSNTLSPKSGEDSS